MDEGSFGSGFLVKRVGASAPVGENHGKADGLEKLGQGADADVLDGPLLGEELGEELKQRKLGVSQRLYNVVIRR